MMKQLIDKIIEQYLVDEEEPNLNKSTVYRDG